MEQLVARNKVVCSRLKEIQDRMEREHPGVAYWDDPEYLSLFTEQSEFLCSYARSRTEVLKDVMKKSIRAQVDPVVHKEKLGDWVFLTINPDDKRCSVDDFVSAAHKFHRKSGISECFYSFEQRGEVEGDYHGFHMHSLFHRTVKPFLVNRSIHGTFDRFVGDPENCHQVKIKYVTLDQCDGIRKYISGCKKSEAKSLKCANDLPFRIHYHLEANYSC